MTRVLVVGAGHNGLVAAIHLAAHGLDVTVLEHAPRPGGSSTSTEHAAGLRPRRSRGVRADDRRVAGDARAGARRRVGGPGRRGRASVPRRERDRAAPGRGGDGELARPGRPRLGGGDGAAAAGREAAGGGRSRAAAADAGRRRGWRWRCAATGWSGRAGWRARSRRSGSTSSKATGARPRGWPAPPSTPGSRRRRPGAARSACCCSCSGTATAGRCRAAGCARWPTRWSRRAESDGATIRCDATVADVLVRGGRVAGVRLAGGEEIGADAVVTTVSAGVLARLLPAGALPGRLHRRLRIWRYGTAPFKLDYALSGPVRWTATEARSAARRARRRRARGVDPRRRRRRSAARCRSARRSSSASSRCTTRRARPPGSTRSTSTRHVPARYDEADDAVAERIEAQLERFAPGFSSLVLDRAMRTPAQTEQENPSLVGGDLAGGSCELDQQLLFRPEPRLCRYGTPLRGLYMAGASDPSRRRRPRHERPRRRPRAPARPQAQARLMPPYGECRVAEIDATPQACFDALTDYERLPEWQGAVRAARVLERDDQGRGAVVEYEVDARIKRVRYRLRQVYDEPHRLGSEYLGGDFRDFAGEWRFARARRRPHPRRARPPDRPGPVRPRPGPPRDRPRRDGPCARRPQAPPRNLKGPGPLGLAFVTDISGDSPLIYQFGLRSRRWTAGPWRTVPSGAKREPWQGQSQDRSARFQLTWQPRWVQVAETAISVPSSSR